jgi:hypothetical protein
MALLAALSSAAMSASAASRFMAWNTISTMLESVAAASTLLWKSLLLLLSHMRPSLQQQQQQHGRGTQQVLTCLIACFSRVTAVTTLQ